MTRVELRVVGFRLAWGRLAGRDDADSLFIVVLFIGVRHQQQHLDCLLDRWDERTDRANRRKHDVSLEAARSILEMLGKNA